MVMFALLYNVIRTKPEMYTRKWFLEEPWYLYEPKLLLFRVLDTHFISFLTSNIKFDFLNFQFFLVNGI